MEEHHPSVPPLVTRAPGAHTYPQSGIPHKSNWEHSAQVYTTIGPHAGSDYLATDSYMAQASAHHTMNRKAMQVSALRCASDSQPGPYSD